MTWVTSTFETKPVRKANCFIGQVKVAEIRLYRSQTQQKWLWGIARMDAPPEGEFPTMAAAFSRLHDLLGMPSPEELNPEVD